MSNNQDINTNAQPADNQDVEGHLLMRSGDGTAEGTALGPQGNKVNRNDTPDGEDDVEGHLLMRSGDGEGKPDAPLGPEGLLV